MNIVCHSEIRLDIFLSDYLKRSRNEVSNLIKNSFITVNNKSVKKAGFKLKPGYKIDIDFPQPTKSHFNQNIDFNVDVIYEDEDILIINKPSGVVVHPAPSVSGATVVDWLIKRGIRLSTISGEERHGIVHRIDKETTGALVIAKDNKTHEALSKQLQDKTMGRYYLALIDHPLKDDVIVDKPIARNPKNRLKMDLVEGGKSAKSAFIKLLNSPKDIELISAKL